MYIYYETYMAPARALDSFVFLLFFLSTMSIRGSDIFSGEALIDLPCTHTIMIIIVHSFTEKLERKSWFLWQQRRYVRELSSCSLAI